jgi:uncharacterized protein (TIGR00297 family)
MSTVALISTCALVGDTWASEVGSVVDSEPRLITTFQVVPPGTNGAVSLVGTLASITGGALFGVLYYVLQKWFDAYLSYSSITTLLFKGIYGGFMGSVFDSLLGATVQITYYNGNKIVSKGTISRGRDFLTNEGVNLISCLMTVTSYFLLF